MTLEEVTAATQWIPHWHDTGACMDRRHIGMLRDILRDTGVARTLEIGVHTGASSSAFIDAGVTYPHFCDLTMTTHARWVVGKSRFHLRKGCDVIASEPVYDLVFVDGNHSLDAVTEEIEALKLKLPRILCAHDVNSTAAGYPHCEGAAALLDWALNRYNFVLWDGEYREGEATQRGFMVAWNDPELSYAIQNAMWGWY